MEQWQPDDLILASRKAVCDRAQELLFTRQKEHFPDMPVPLLYHPKDSRKQREELALNDVIQVTIEAAEKAVKTDDWRLGYALTVHSSLGLTIKSPQKVWIIDDYLQWSNLAYLAVSRVEYIGQLQRIASPPAEGTEVGQPMEESAQALRKAIQKKLVAYKRQDQGKALKGLHLKVDYILQLKEKQQNHCAGWWTSFGTVTPNFGRGMRLGGGR